LSGAGASSIAAIVITSTAVSMTRVSLKAGNAADGSNGAAQSNYSAGQAVQGNSPSNVTPNIGASPQSCTCTLSGAGVGGSGGNGSAIQATGGSPGTPSIQPPSPSNATGAGGTPGDINNSCTNGTRGS